MKFCVLIKIRRNIVSFWYQIKGSNYAPLKIKESNEAPLFFYVNGNDFIFGNYAKDRYYCNDPFAYGDYFKIITDPSKQFSIYGNKKPIKQLLYIGIEQYLDFFIKNVLYKSDSIESYRQNFPLRLSFDSDIEDKEKYLIESLFKEAGYDNVQREFYHHALLNCLVTEGLINANSTVLLLTGIDNVLYLELFKSQFCTPDATARIDGQGSDPRVRILSEIILDDILARNSYLQINRDKEIAALVHLSASILRDSTPILSGDAILSDGSSYYFKVKTRDLNDRLLYYTDDNKIFSSIDDLFKDVGIKPNSVFLLLNGSEISTDYFSEKLLKKYPNVKGIPQSLEAIALKFIFKKVEEEDYLSKRNNAGAPSLPPLTNQSPCSENNKSEANTTPVPPPYPPPPSLKPKVITKDPGVPPPLPPPSQTIPKRTTSVPPPPPPPPVPKKNDSQKTVVTPPPPPPSTQNRSEKKLPKTSQDSPDPKKKK